MLTASSGGPDRNGYCKFTGGTGWTCIPSDRNLKSAFYDLLDRLEKMPV